jgi:hypothetical protein
LLPSNTWAAIGEPSPGDGRCLPQWFGAHRDGAVLEEGARVPRAHPASFLCTSLVLAGCLAAPPGDGLGITRAVVDCSGIPEWTDGRSYAVGDVVSHQGGVFRCSVAHTPALDWEPAIVPALWDPATCGDGGDDGGAPPDEPPSDTPPDRAFPPVLDPRYFQLDLPSTGLDPSGAQLVVVGQISAHAFRSFQELLDVASVATGTDDAGRPLQIHRAEVGGVRFESHNTIAGGVQEVVVFVDGIKRLQYVRDLRDGAFQGVLVGNGEDRGAPMVAVVTPVGTELSHLLIADIGNNQRNDLRAALFTDRALIPVRFGEFRQFQGGMAGQEESRAVVERFDFSGVITGF